MNVKLNQAGIYKYLFFSFTSLFGARQHKFKFSGSNCRRDRVSPT